MWGSTRVSVARDRILGIMGDGNCLYRALGVAMILHPRLIHRPLDALRALVYCRLDAPREEDVGRLPALPGPEHDLPARHRPGVDSRSGAERGSPALKLRVEKYAQRWGLSKTYTRRRGPHVQLRAARGAQVQRQGVAGRGAGAGHA